MSQVFHRVPIQPRDAREASEVFYNQHQGDVLLNYENEVIMTNISYADTNQEEKVLPYVVPQNNVKVAHDSPPLSGVHGWHAQACGCTPA